jgi:hypothetical protein
VNLRVKEKGYLFIGVRIDTSAMGDNTPRAATMHPQRPSHPANRCILNYARYMEEDMEVEGPEKYVNIMNMTDSNFLLLHDECGYPRDTSKITFLIFHDALFLSQNVPTTYMAYVNWHMQQHAIKTIGTRII